MSLFDPEPPPVAADSSHPVFDPYYEWFSISPSEQPPNHYCLLGITLYEDNSEVISSAADRQAIHVKSCKLGKHADDCEMILSEIFAAKVCLLDSKSKAEYDQTLRSALKASVQPFISKRKVRRRGARRSKRKSPSWEMIKIITGGIIGSIIALCILWFGFGIDPLGIMTSSELALNQPALSQIRGDIDNERNNKSDNISEGSKQDTITLQRKIRDLQMEVTRLKNDLEVKSSDLDKAKNNVFAAKREVEDLQTENTSLRNNISHERKNPSTYKYQKVMVWMRSLSGSKWIALLFSDGRMSREKSLEELSWTQNNNVITLRFHSVLYTEFLHLNADGKTCVIKDKNNKVIGEGVLIDTLYVPVVGEKTE